MSKKNRVKIYNELRIETNPFKIIMYALPFLVKKPIFIIWIIVSLLLLILTYYEKLLGLKLLNLNIQSHFSLSFTALSFSLAVTSAFLTLFKKRELVQIYLYKDNVDEVRIKYKKWGDLFYESISLYIMVPTLWLIISIISLLSNIIEISVLFNYKKYLDVLYISLIFGGLLLTWKSYINHLYDVINKVQLEVNREVMNDRN